nr:hypothetical protein [Tanacetum cinerariifolium]
GIEMEKRNIQDRSALSIDHHRAFIQVMTSPVIHQPPQELSIQEMEDLKRQYLDELKRLSNLEYRDEIKIAEWAYLSIHPSKRLTSFCYDADDDEDYTSAITPDEPVLSTEEPDNSLSMGDDHLDTIQATESNEFIKSSIKNLIPIPSESEEFFSIDDDSFSIDDIDYVEALPPDSELVSSGVMKIVIPESSSTSLNSLLEETNTFDNSLPEFETFCFDVEEISSSSTTTHPDISLPEYEAFCDDHVREISSGSLTTHFDSSLYASFIYDLSINPFPPADKSDFYEFSDELIPFISPPHMDKNYSFQCSLVGPMFLDIRLEMLFVDENLILLSSTYYLCIGNLEPLRLDVLALKANDVSFFGENCLKVVVTPEALSLCEIDLTPSVG